MWQIQKWNNENYAWCDNVFNEDELNEIIKYGNLLNKNPAEISDGLDNEIRKSQTNRFIALETDKYNWIYQKFVNVVNDINNDFFKFDLSYLEYMQFAEYKKDEFYKCHKDQGYNDSYSRKLSIVMQLTDENEYEGGELYLYPTSFDYPEIMSRKKGRIFVFPSYILHEVKPVTKGLRNSLVCWVHGARFK